MIKLLFEIRVMYLSFGGDFDRKMNFIGGNKSGYLSVGTISSSETPVASNANVRASPSAVPLQL